MLTIPCPACGTSLALRAGGESCYTGECGRCCRAAAVVELAAGYTVALFEHGKRGASRHNDEWLPDLWTVMKETEAAANREPVARVATRRRRTAGRRAS